MEDPCLLVLGASGFLGRNLLLAAAGRAVVAVSRTPDLQPAQDHVRWIPLDTWTTELARLRERGPVTAIHAIALTDHGYCERNPEEAMKVNAGSAAAAARACRSLDVPLIHVSTDGLFPNLDPAGSPRYWTLSDIPNPVSVYGRSKLAAEHSLAELGWGHVVRMSFVGPGHGTRRGLIAFLADRLRSGAAVPGFTDIWFTPAPAAAAAGRLVALAGEAGAGHSIRQWGCHPALTKYDFLSEVAGAAGFAPRMEPCLRSALPGAGTVQLDQSLSCEDPWTRQELIAQSVRALLAELT
jgi:dTDP-4-dehydrorhamnose reductase